MVLRRFSRYLWFGHTQNMNITGILHTEFQKTKTFKVSQKYLCGGPWDADGWQDRIGSFSLLCLSNKMIYDQTYTTSHQQSVRGSKYFWFGLNLYYMFAWLQIQNHPFSPLYRIILILPLHPYKYIYINIEAQVTESFLYD